jgi:hypothetical protein
MDSMALVMEKLARATAMGSSALRSHDISQVERFEQKLQVLDSLCREAFQETLHDLYLTIAEKLEKGTEALSPREREAVELLFTGEAKYYLKTENSYDDWVAELERLIRELEATRAGGLGSIADLMHVQALCRDALHVLPELSYYLREKERVALFRQNLDGELTRESGRMLARMIRDLMSSPRR